MRTPWQPGDEIGPYRLEHLIGQGAVGQVWLGRDVRLERQVAIKVIDALGGDSAAAERFGREARALAHLSHPSIVQVYDVGREGEYRYIVTEFVDGPNLATLISRGKIRLGWAIPIAKQVSEAIQRAHELRIVHRDIKPSNILVDARYDRAKVSDFGLAKGAEHLATITSSEAILGTPAYMAPEQLEGISSPASDIYSLGATLYHLFTGVPPREATNIVSLIKNLDTARPREPKELRPELPIKLSALLLHMLEAEPTKRLTALDELRGVLLELEAQFPAPQGQSLEERAIEAREDRPVHASLTQIEAASVPPGFFDRTVFSRSQFFRDDSVRFSKIQESLNFYRDHLNQEYQSLLSQANLTYRLWLGCVGLGFLVLLGGVSAMLLGRIQEGAATAACTIFIYFIQRVFQQREDHYRSLATSKNSHLEYGNHWLLVIQSIDSIEDATERSRRQSRLVDVLTKRLGISNKPEVA
jgi:serine/threonine protein kinase